MIDAVVFDLDGVLIDSEPLWERVRREVVAEYGGHWRPEAEERLMGMSTAEWARYLSEDLGVDRSPGQVADLVIERMAQCYARQVPVLPGAVAAVRRLAERWPLGLASSSPRRLIDTVLDLPELRGLFSATVSTEELARGKPAPDVYLAATDRLGVPPTSAAAVEDSTNGVRSAVDAGCHVIAVPRARYPVDAAVLAQAAVVLRSLDELTADLVESGLR